jgi:hypothetical protein
VLVGLVDFHILLIVMAAGLGLAAVYAFVKLREAVEASPDGSGLEASALADLPVLDHEPAVGLHTFEQAAVVADQ